MDSWPATGIGTTANYDTDWWDKKTRICDTYIQNILQSTNGSAEYRHVTGEISIVRLEVTGMGMWRIRIAILPPEVTERYIRAALASYGDIVSIQD